MKKYSRIYAVVHLDSIRTNMETLKANVGNAKLCAVVKTDGYGLGAVPIAKEVEEFVWGYAVATIEEALNLRAHYIQKPILVLGYVPKEHFKELIENEIRFAAYQENDAKFLNETALSIGKKAIVHVAVDTGMSRIGLFPDDAFEFIKKMEQMSGIELEGMFSHFATADMKNREHSWEQAKKFEDLMKKLDKAKISIPVCHIGNSAASMEMLQIPGSMFREGISMYGYYPSEEMDRENVKLRPAMELKARIAYVKKLPPNVAIGYGGTFVTSRETKVATVTIGYGDGYPRSLSNKGMMLVHGKRARILGRVCMDQTMIDVTGIDNVKAGDLATVIGREGNDEITLEEAAALSGRFNYEFLCDLGKRIPRIYKKNGEIIGNKDYFFDEYSDF